MSSHPHPCYTPLGHRLVVFLLGVQVTMGQMPGAPAVSFKHLTEADGLANGNVRSLAQDRYGFIWVGTDNGLCRFDGRSVKTFRNVRHDTSSLPYSGVDGLFTDPDGTLWAGTFQTLSRFDYRTQTFRRFDIPSSATNISGAMIEGTPGTLWIATSKGIRCFDRRTLRFTPGPFRDPALRQRLNSHRIFNLKRDDQGRVYTATDRGLLIIDPLAQTLRHFHHDPANPLTMSDDYVFSATPDHRGGVWLGVGYSQGLVEYLELKTGRVRKIDMRQFQRYQPQSVRINDILVEPNGRVWIGANRLDLISYDPVTDRFEQYQQDVKRQPWSNARGHDVNILFQDRQGLIWAGKEIFGVTWFNPRRSAFTVFGESQDPQTSLPDKWTRAAVEDRSGRLWFGTAGGLVAYAPGRGFVRRFTPTADPLPSYSIRALANDPTGAIWIGTASGLNRFSITTNVLRSYPEPDAGGGFFYWDLLVTRQGTVWAASSGGLRRYNARHDRFEKLEADSLFRPYAHWRLRSLAEAPDGGLWIGTIQQGLIYWHPQRRILRHYQHQPGDRRSLVDNLVTSMAFDKSGRLWVGTINGLCAFDSTTQSFEAFDSLFHTNRFASLLFDHRDRLWMGSDVGLFCLETDRRTIHRFDQGDGLPANQFNDQRAARLRDGRFCYPTLQGFAVFRPDDLLATERRPAPASFLTNFSVFDKAHRLPQNPETTREVRLQPDENFFTFEWAALHYDNPEKCHYSYRLVGFDRDWVYPDDPRATYTNVPGGDYEFEFRSSLTAGQWEGPLRRVHVHVGTVFYKSVWFIALVVLLVVAAAVGFYQYRIRQAFRMGRLQMRATKLEKDNALVQYQNLINQLNPHFLFNSLAVLDGLITKDGKMASRYLSRLTKVYRYLIENDRVEVVPLEKELRFAADFISLLTTRYGGGFSAEVDVPEAMNAHKVVPVTLQNLIENAIKHNTTDAESPLRVCIRVRDEYLVVENNLQKRAVVKNSNRKGLHDLQRLYRYLTDRPLRIQETDTQFAVYVPLLE